MKIFSSAGFWISVAGLILAVALFFLLPLLGVTTVGIRLLLALLPLLLGLLLWLLLRLLRLKRAIRAKDSTGFEGQAFASQLTMPWAEALQRQTREALEILRTSAKSKAGVGRNPLDIYRFYLVLGSESAGKSTLLEHSGIHFPRRFPGAAELARQTQTFTQWWFSGQGIFLETPARYVTGSEGDDELRVWLEQMRREGKRLAMDAVVLAISLEELLAGDAAALAARHRERIAVILSTLKLDLPVYVVFTHADLLPGFGDFFENLRDPDSQQVFGATLALKGSLASARDRFEREYRRVWDTLAARVPYRLSQLNDPGQKQRVFSFPNEFGAAQERLAAFCEHLFKDTMARERALFRGFFFTSVRQPETDESGAWVESGDPALHPLDVRAKLRSPSGPMRPEPQKARALFTQLLFNGVLKSDRSLAQIPGYRLGSLSRKALLTAGGLSLLGLLIIAYGVTGYLKGTARLRRLATAAETASQIRFANPSSFEREFANLSELEAQIDSLASGQNSSWLIPPGFGHAADAADQAGRLHAVLLDRLALRDVVRDLAASLEIAAKYFNPADHGTLHDNLRLYLLLTTQGQPHLEDVRPEDLTAALQAPVAQEITRKMGAENLPPNFEAELQPHLRLWAQNFMIGRQPALAETDPNLTRDVRAALLGNPSIDGLYNSIVAAEDPSLNLTLETMGVPADGILKSSAQVRGFYTKAGFDQGALQALADGAEQPYRRDWVLGDSVTAKLPPEMQDKQKLAHALVDRYFEAYAEEWTHFLQSLSVRVPPEPGPAAGKLAGFASVNQGLPLVLNRVLTEVNLFAPPSAADSSVMKRVKASKFNKLAQMAMAARDADKKALQDKFNFVQDLMGTGGSGGALQEYFNSVRGLSDVLNRISLSGDGSGENLDAAQQLFQGKVDNPLNIAWNEASKASVRYETQAWLGPLLEEPVRDVAGNLIASAGRYLESLYETKVAPFYVQNLKGRYPIARTATLDVNLEDLKAFFAADNGVFSTFLNTKLGPFLRPADNGFALATWNGLRLPMTPTALATLSRAQTVGQRVAGDTPGAFRVSTLNLTLPEAHNTTRVTLRLGDDQMSVKTGEGQARQTFKWPTETSYKGADITVETPGGAVQTKHADGAFALMKLLDQARALNVRPAGFTAKWRFTVAQRYDVDVSLDGNLPDRENPFSTPDYFHFELPAKLMSESVPAVAAGTTAP